MVSTNVDARLLGFHVVAHEVAVADSSTLCRLDVDEGYGKGSSLCVVAFSQRGNA